MSITRVRAKMAQELVEIMDMRTDKAKVATPDNMQDFAKKVAYFDIHEDKPYAEALRLLRTHLKTMVANGYEPQNDYLLLLVEPITDVELQTALGSKNDKGKFIPAQLHLVQTQPEFTVGESKSEKIKKAAPAEKKEESKKDEKSDESKQGTGDGSEQKGGDLQEGSESKDGGSDSGDGDESGSSDNGGEGDGKPSTDNAGNEDKGDGQGSGDKGSDDSSGEELPTKRGELDKILIDLGVDETEVKALQNKGKVVDAIIAMREATKASE